jgi:UDP-glucose 4-epimerase
MRIVIIGATGNIGTAVLRRVRDSEAITEVVGVARRRPDARVEPYRGADWHTVDVSAPGIVPELTSILEGADAVIHLAWLLQPNHRERELWATNVDGLRRTLAAASAADVPHVVVVSSVGAYSRGPKHTRVDEDWPTGGIHTSHYSRHKAVDERLLDAFEAEHPDVVLTRVRPGLVFQRGAANEIAGLFAGSLLPVRWLGRVRIPILTVPAQVISQAVHADDLADAIVRIVERRAAGAFNIAGEPVLDPEALGEVLGARRVVPVRLAVVRALMWVTWKLRLQASDPGWLDIAANVPVMSTERARSVLGWTPRHRSTDALREVLDGLADGAGVEASPPLSPGA